MQSPEEVRAEIRVVEAERERVWAGVRRLLEEAERIPHLLDAAVELAGPETWTGGLAQRRRRELDDARTYVARAASTVVVAADDGARVVSRLNARLAELAVEAARAEAQAGVSRAGGLAVGPWG